MGPRLPPSLLYAGTYATSHELGFEEYQSEVEIAVRLSELSVYDCLSMVGTLSAALHTSPYGREQQVRLAGWLMNGRDDWIRRAATALANGRLLVFAQQLAHLARLAAKYGDTSPARGFDDPQDRQRFLECLFAVPDLFYDGSVDLSKREDRLSWALRHAFISHQREPQTLGSIYFEVFCERWSAEALGSQYDIEAAFRRHTGTSIEVFMAVGMSLMFAFLATAQNGFRAAVLDPREYFSSTRLAVGEVDAFLNTSSTTVADLRSALSLEEERFGKTTFGALAYEQTPLVADPDGRIYLLSLESLSRRWTEGILHVLAEGAEAEGRPREDFTNPFGKVFESWAADCFRRSARTVTPAPRMLFDAQYGNRRSLRRTPDVVLDYERVLVVVEVVSGPLRAATVTHGDLKSLELDMAKLIEKKARQLTKRVAEIMNGEAMSLGLDSEKIVSVYPVIVTATSLPLRPEIGDAIRRRLKDKGLLQARYMRPLSLISAEELAAAEGVMESGAQFRDLIKEWKGTQYLQDHSFKNFLITINGGKLGVGQHHRDQFDAAIRRLVGLALGDGLAEQILTREEMAKRPASGRRDLLIESPSAADLR